MYSFKDHLHVAFVILGLLLVLEWLFSLFGSLFYFFFFRFSWSAFHFFWLFTWYGLVSRSPSSWAVLKHLILGLCSLQEELCMCCCCVCTKLQIWLYMLHTLPPQCLSPGPKVKPQVRQSSSQSSGPLSPELFNLQQLFSRFLSDDFLYYYFFGFCCKRSSKMYLNVDIVYIYT